MDNQLSHKRIAVREAAYLGCACAPSRVGEYGKAYYWWYYYVPTGNCHAPEDEQ